MRSPSDSELPWGGMWLVPTDKPRFVPTSETSDAPSRWYELRQSGRYAYAKPDTTPRIRKAKYTL